MDSTRKPDIIIQLALILVALMVLVRYLSLERARQFRKLSLEMINQYEFPSRIHEARSYEESVDGESILCDSASLSQDVLRSICKCVLQRNYSLARSKLEKLGFRNPKISKRGDLILIYHDKGKLIIDSKQMRILG